MTDVWTDGPAGFSPEHDPEDLPGSISRSQQRALFAAFASLGIKDRETRLTWTGNLLDLGPVGSSNDLSYRQAGDLLMALQSIADTGHA